MRMMRANLEVERAARRLGETTRRWRGMTFMDSVVGSVAVDRVVLHLSHRSFRNAFDPVFRGRFAAVRGRTYLAASFALRRTTQAFMTGFLHHSVLPDSRRSCS